MELLSKVLMYNKRGKKETHITNDGTVSFTSACQLLIA